MSIDPQELKRRVAHHAVTLITPGMVVGLGSGSTATLAIRRIGELLAQGELTDIVGVPTSARTEAEAIRAAIPLTTLEAHPFLDLTIDGADEVDPRLNVIKGGGGALLREKIVAQATARQVIIVDDSKLSPQLGTHWPVPIEVISFGWGSQAAFLETLGATVQLRTTEADQPFLTDHGNFILDCNFGPIADLRGLTSALERRSGIVEHGLFVQMTTDLLVAGSEGIRHLQAKSAARK